MRLEHVALQVSDPVAMADWYVKHLGCAVARAGPAQSRALSGGRPGAPENYQSASAPTPDYPSMHPSQLHLAFVSENLKADRDRLLAAGARVCRRVHRQSGRGRAADVARSLGRGPATGPPRQADDLVTGTGGVGIGKTWRQSLLLRRI